MWLSFGSRSYGAAGTLCMGSVNILHTSTYALIYWASLHASVHRPAHERFSGFTTISASRSTAARQRQTTVKSRINGMELSETACLSICPSLSSP